MNPWCRIVALALISAVATAAAASPVRPGVVVGESMSPSYHTGDLYLLARGAASLRRHDVVVFRQDGQTYVKRVVALPGDTIYLVRRRGERTQDVIHQADLQRFLRLRSFRSFRLPIHVEPYVVPEGALFVLGDHLGDSEDSRELGPILMENLVGRVLSPPPPAPALVRLAGEFRSPSRF